MKALIVSCGNSRPAIELIAETAEERRQLRRFWTTDNSFVSCEEWREIVAGAGVYKEPGPSEEEE